MIAGYNFYVVVGDSIHYLFGYSIYQQKNLAPYAMMLLVSILISPLTNLYLHKKKMMIGDLHFLLAMGMQHRRSENKHQLFILFIFFYFFHLIYNQKTLFMMKRRSLFIIYLFSRYIKNKCF